MTGERRKVRSTKALANDERILDAATALLDAHGVDGFGVADVARTAGLTTGAFYARYTNIGELLADLWLERSLRVLDDLAEESAALARDWPAIDTDRFASLLASSAERQAAFELLVASTRIDELGDVVPRSGRGALRDAGLVGGADGTDHTGILLLGLALGSAAHGPVDLTLERDAAAIVSWLQASAARVPIPHAADAATIPLGISFMPHERDGVSDRDLRRPRLLNGAISVIARSGVRRANLRRISRAAGYAHTAVYQEYGSLHELLVDLVGSVLAAVVKLDTTPGAYTSPEREGAWLAGLLGPRGRLRRRVALELWIASAHDPDFAAAAARTDLQRSQAIAELLTDGRSAAYDTIVAYRYARRGLFFGLAALNDAIERLDMDWEQFAARLLSGALVTAGVPEGR